MLVRQAGRSLNVIVIILTGITNVFIMLTYLIRFLKVDLLHAAFYLSYQVLKYIYFGTTLTNHSCDRYNVSNKVCSFVVVCFLRVFEKNE